MSGRVIQFRNQTHTDSERKRIGGKGQNRVFRPAPTGGMLSTRPPKSEHIGLTKIEKARWGWLVGRWPWLRESDAPLLIHLLQAMTRLENLSDRVDQAVKEKEPLKDVNGAAARVKDFQKQVSDLMSLLGGVPGRRVGEDTATAGGGQVMKGMLKGAGLFG